MTQRPLRPCGPRRDCVSTQALRSRSANFIEPLRFVAPPATVQVAVLRVLERSASMRILERDPHSVHAVVVSRLLRVHTDVDVRLDVAAGLVHVRVSAPRLMRGRTTSRAQALDLLARIDQEIRRLS